MPRRKKLPTVPDYKGLTKNEDKRVVQKSNPLQTLSETNLTLPEFKILDAYLSKIDSHIPDKRYVRFEKGELEQLLGVSRMHRDELERRLRNLFQVLKIQDKHKNKGFSLIALFEKAECEQDENGQWQVDLACSASAMEYVFNVDNIGYLRYRLKNVVDLTSRYSYILYLYLENNRFRKQWTIALSELKDLLRCNADTYNEFKRFNDLVLKKCHKELNEKTNIKYSYEPIKKGRRVAEISFTVETLADEIDDNQLTFDELPTAADEEAPDLDEQMTEKYGSEMLQQLAEACKYEFTREQMEEIFSVLNRINIPPDKNTGDIHWGRVFYLREKYAALNVEDSRKKASGTCIKSRYAYFKKMLEKDTSTPAAYTE